MELETHLCFEPPLFVQVALVLVVVCVRRCRRSSHTRSLVEKKNVRRTKKKEKKRTYLGLEPHFIIIDGGVLVVPILYT